MKILSEITFCDIKNYETFANPYHSFFKINSWIEELLCDSEVIRTDIFMKFLSYDSALAIQIA